MAILKMTKCRNRSIHCLWSKGIWGWNQHAKYQHPKANIKHMESYDSTKSLLYLSTGMYLYR